MPIYDFRCGGCGVVSEILLREGDPNMATCPHCGSGDMRKLFSTFNTISKGPGRSGTTCCGREERCSAPPCSADEGRCTR